MTKETLQQCRSASLARISVKKRIAELREDAAGISGIRYGGDAPRSRGEPLSRQQRYVEALEQLSAEYEETTAAWAEKADKKAALLNAFHACNMDGAVTLKDMAEYLGISEKTVRRRVKDCGELTIADNSIQLSEMENNGGTK